MALDQWTGPATAAAQPTAAAAAAAAPARAGSGFSFRELLSDLNPLQYIPGVGAIYRAITGDEGNADLRFVASLGTSFALGGPVGVGITVAERVTGIDPEKIGRHLLAGLLHPAAASAGAAAGTATATGRMATAGATIEPARGEMDARPWSADELAAYGVAGSGDGEADMLNRLELHRLSTTTYA